MKAATLQFAPRLGDVKYNISHADSLLETANLEGVELLILPELAFTGYNFPTLFAISDYLEPSCKGATAWWAAKTAKLYNLIVSIGYPEITTDPKAIPSKVVSSSSEILNDVIKTAQGYVTSIKTAFNADRNYWTFNSTLTVAPDGSVVAHYRKTHLYYTDATWASPSIEGFSSATLSVANQAIKTSFAICMDLNPRAFTADWQDYEVARNSIASNASLLIVSTAWMDRDEATMSNDDLSCCPPELRKQPDMDVLSHWIGRLMPLMEQERDTIVIIANRIGNEPGMVKACDLEQLTRPIFKAEPQLRGQSILEGTQEHGQLRNTALISPPITGQNTASMDELTTSIEDDALGVVSRAAHYAGTSVVLKLGHGRASVHGVLGRGEEGVLIADTNNKAMMAFRRRVGEEEEADEQG